MNEEGSCSLNWPIKTPHLIGMIRNKCTGFYPAKNFFASLKQKFAAESTKPIWLVSVALKAAEKTGYRFKRDRPRLGYSRLQVSCLMGTIKPKFGLDYIEKTVLC